MQRSPHPCFLDCAVCNNPIASLNDYAILTAPENDVFHQGAPYKIPSIQARLKRSCPSRAYPSRQFLRDETPLWSPVGVAGSRPSSTPIHSSTPRDGTECPPFRRLAVCAGHDAEESAIPTHYQIWNCRRALALILCMARPLPRGGNSMTPEANIVKTYKMAGLSSGLPPSYAPSLDGFLPCTLTSLLSRWLPLP